MLQHIIYS